MARGRLLKTKVREAKALEKAKVEQYYKSKWRMYKNQPIGILIKEWLSKAAKNIDPIETAAIGGMTIIVHGIILGSEDILKQVTGYGNLSTPPPINLPAIGFLTLIPWLLNNNPDETTPTEVAKKNELEIWLISFTIAFVLIRYMGEIISLAGNLANSVRSLLGMALIAA